MLKLSEHAVDLILEGDLEGAEEYILAESVEDKLLRAVGEVSILNYLMKFEQYLSEFDVYLYDGWDDPDKIQIAAMPEIGNYWCTFMLRVPAKVDLRGAKRLLSDKTAQNQIKVKKGEDGMMLLKFKILKRELDRLEQDNKLKSEEIADREDPTGAPKG